MGTLDNYLFFQGNCAQAMRFYERVLGGELQAMLTFGQSPDPKQCPPGAADLVMHANLRLGNRNLMATDVPPGMPREAMGGFSLSLMYEAPEEARRIFDALAEGGQVKMAMQETFWAASFGMLVDRFGTPWMVGGGQRRVG